MIIRKLHFLARSLSFVMALGLSAHILAATTPSSEQPRALVSETDYWDDLPMDESLRQQLEQYKNARVVKVTDRVYAARGYDFANIMFVIGDEGIIVIDTGEFTETSEAALADLREVTGKPISAVIYSHGHSDHTGGVRAFIPEGSEERIPIYASARWERFQRELVSSLDPTISRRAYKQIGFRQVLDGKDHMTAVGPYRTIGNNRNYLAPTRTIDKPTELIIDGVTMLFYPIHSELDDEMMIWLPEEKVAYGADAIGDVLVWFTTPRFELGRDHQGFIRSANQVASWEPDHLVLGHGKVFHGREKISRLLNNQTEAVQSVIDQTIHYINEGKDMRETAALVKLPKHLADDPYLGEHYHRLSWMVKGLYTKFAGWYGDDAVEMIRHIPSEEAQRMVSLAGGRKKFMQHVQFAYDSGDFPWAAQLATYLLKIEPKAIDASRVKAAAFRKMASTTPSSNERDYLLSEAGLLEDPTYLDFPSASPIMDIFALVPTWDFVELFGPRLNIERSPAYDITINLQLEDTGEEFFLQTRKGVLARDSGRVKTAEATLQLSREMLYQLASGVKSYDELVTDGSLRTIGSSTKAQLFFSLFE